MDNVTGYICLVLHAHLPFVRHPEEPDFLEEDWLFEAITETYIPILHRMEELRTKGIHARLTMTWTPPLCEMLVDPLLQGRYRHHLQRMLELAEQEVPAKAKSNFADAAVMYRDHYKFCLQQLDRWRDNILDWVKDLMHSGHIEPITCGATHGFLPLMSERSAQRAQIAVAAENFAKHFGRRPKGIWLPECGYVPGVEELLAEEGIQFFFLESHGIYYGSPRPRYGVYAPVFTESGPAAFARDPETSRSVWSAESGYPGNPLYREFYRDLGYDGDYDYVKNFLHNDGERRNLGLKYHRITGKVDLHQKEPYVPSWAYAQASRDADDFVTQRYHQAQELKHQLGKPPVIVAPYDAELFGHWWYEGPQFISSIFHSLQQFPDLIAVTPVEYLAENRVHQVQTPCASSWGANGYNNVWLNKTNDWIYRHLHAAEGRMREAALRFPEPTPLQRRYLNQMARELLLAQSSDWAFIMTTNTTVPYAIRRTRDHINRFTGLYEQLVNNKLQVDTLTTIEWRDSIFQEIDYRVYARD